MAERFCLHCGAALAPGASTCGTCGTPITPGPVTAPVAGAPGAVPPAPPPVGAAPSGPARHRGPGRFVPLLIALVGLVVVVATVLVARGGDDGGSGGEIFLEAAVSTGQSPFTEPLDPATTATTAPPTTAASPITVVQPTSGVAPPPGSRPYGGSGDDRVCNREQLIAFLTANPGPAAAWAGVLGVAVDQIPAYVRSLTPSVLLYDTRVTNHGFANGRATTLQSVLQAGTAVLVDPSGNPVVRCRCGNPLQPPAPVRAPVLQGTPWPGFNPTTVVSVNNGVTVTVVIDATSSTGSTGTTGGTGGTTPSSTPNPDASRIQGLLAVLAECTNGAPVQVVDVAPDPDLPNTVTARLVVNGVTMIFTYDSTTGTIGEGDRASAELLATCGVHG